MKTYPRIVASMIVLACATALVAQDAEEAPEEPVSQYERVKQLEPYLGIWTGDFQPPGGPEGTLMGISRWTSNRSYAQFQWSFRPDDGEQGAPMHVATILIGWDGKNQRLGSWAFFPDAVSAGEVSMTDNGLVISAKGTSAEGEATSAKATYKLEGDKLTVTVSDVKAGDQSPPGYSFTVTKRERRGQGGQGFGGGRRRTQAE